ncbi:bifunctional UDP-N-acetylglucosamine diphosphorylase/glucosamine-1-phosphate N-acetyltransferase GlmU [Auraticoccus sp. F435]|uniref:Bifunctional protein GlmU n=1 Tax=Auraticoccus cholistanensis TaxID=2656650 RepID=A0A6A9UVD4_9ACTN|nr:bifunctional UDP-N-acetylglucosamine diphosphorylase/glucosamine-1-phosphate N-acetyltransferase GlmU [Auraticoccus cholistanensis]MVA76648.1 bifunctional UDP-N-acetylglucosamine diphosphorylase/glucosamine-1-phosphate N-acetyltransferase GlmU [Auraticoccus cholistanensis]
MTAAPTPDPTTPGATPPDPSASPGVSAVVVLAAGGGTRMKSARSKLLHELGGRSLLSHALRAAGDVRPRHLVVVVGHARDQVEPHVAELAPQALIAVQQEQLGTGHAVQCGLRVLPALDGEVLVTYGDVPMLTGDTLAQLLAAHRAEGNAVTVLTADVPDPTGYGRVLRGAGGDVERIVEHRDADEATRAVTEINSGIYVFSAATLTRGLGRLRADNAQGELYLTDVLGLARGDGERVGAFRTDDLWQTEGVNDRVQLARMNAELNRRTVERWMREGVTVVDPATTWVDADVTLARDVVLHPGTILAGATTVAEGAEIGPDTRLRDCEVGAGASVVRSEAQLAVVGEGAVVGPWSYLRPGTELGRRGKIGAFVETKKARIGDGSKVPHLSYVGDATIGTGVNVGAGTITANYDGVDKFPTVVADGAFIGSGSVLVAPAQVGEGAFVAAGSTVTEPVPAGDLAVARGRQRNVEGWAERRRASRAAAREDTTAAQ